MASTSCLMKPSRNSVTSNRATSEAQLGLDMVGFRALDRHSLLAYEFLIIRRIKFAEHIALVHRRPVGEHREDGRDTSRGQLLALDTDLHVLELTLNDRVVRALDLAARRHRKMQVRPAHRDCSDVFPGRPLSPPIVERPCLYGTNRGRGQKHQRPDTDPTVSPGFAALAHDELDSRLNLEFARLGERRQPGITKVVPTPKRRNVRKRSGFGVQNLLSRQVQRGRAINRHNPLVIVKH